MEPQPPYGNQEKTLASIVGSISASIDRALSPGEVAELRRLRPHDPDCAPYWRLLGLHIENHDGAPPSLSELGERRWAVVIQALATMRGLHQPRARLGSTLASTGLAETRFLRLLRAHGDSLADTVRVIAQFLANSACASDHSQLAHLVLSDGRSDEESVRRRIARDYYGHAEKKGTT